MDHNLEKRIDKTVPDKSDSLQDDAHEYELSAARTDIGDDEKIRKEDVEETSHREEENLARIATNLVSRTQSFSRAPSAADNAAIDPTLDPSNPQFDARRWAELSLSSVRETNDYVLKDQSVVFKDFSISGSGSALQYQETVFSLLTVPFRKLVQAVTPGHRRVGRRRILHNFNGLLKSGELLLVLGRPGSGCSTFLKSICGHLGGLTMESGSDIHYNGLSFEEMTKYYRGEVAYNQEMDEHFPHLTVGQTLAFAAYARTPEKRPRGLTRDEYVATMVRVVMAIFGLSHTFNTKVGDNFVRGVSGGERKRVSLAEMFLARPRIGAWDNSTRGLDSASALQFIKSLRMAADLGNSCHAVAAYQASQSMYDLFDQVIVLYEGYEVFYGPIGRAVQYFQEMGWNIQNRQLAPDFLTAVTNPAERRPREGFEHKVPRTAVDFYKYWIESEDYKQLLMRIAEYEIENPLRGEESEKLRQRPLLEQTKRPHQSNSYLLSIRMQIDLAVHRAFQRMRNDIPSVASTAIVQIILSLIIGSIFYNSPNSTNAFFQRGAVMYFSVLMNCLITINEILLLYSQRPIIEKQTRYAFIRPFTESLASIISDFPVKLIRCSAFSIVLYFMANLRREPSQFFVFYLFLITAIVTMSGIFRSLGSLTRTIGQAMSIAGILVLVFVVYTGFTLPQTYMHPWLSWIRWINPIYYTFESLVCNEFHGRQFECATIVPSYGKGENIICAVPGAIAGERTVSGDRFIKSNYNYEYRHVWRNYGILLGFFIAFHCFYLFISEVNSGSGSKAEALVFRPGRAPKHLQRKPDEEEVEGLPVAASPEESVEIEEVKLPKHTDILMWQGLNYDISVKEGTKRLLNDVNGWVKPGTLTALMGVSGAGKTTLLDVLAQRVSIGVVTGDSFISGRPLPASFPRRIGYVQQQDMHLSTTTVREALQFSALLRQPKSVSTAEKKEYVEEVIRILGMEDFSEAIVGGIGEGLNVEQRKLLSIGVELAAKPTLLIFLDEPTSGLDSQSSWTICSFLRKLSNHGQAVLATIHQPSAVLFEQFDRLLFLAAGGKTVYFGDIGHNAQFLLKYFERNGARPCGSMENPAEYILGIVSGDQAKGVDFVAAWNNSPEKQEVLAELERLKGLAKESSDSVGEYDELEHSEFAMPMYMQFYYVMWRALQQYWREPEYIYSKYILGIVSGLLIGFSFYKADASIQGFQNAMFGVFLMCTIFNSLVNQIVPRFVNQRALYEVRERPSRTYSWQIFILTRMLVEVPWQLVLGVCAWASFYFSVFGANQPAQVKGVILLFIVQFYIYASSMAQLVIAAVNQPPIASIFAVLMFGMSLVFSGVMQPPENLPGFWIFMYRVSPFTYYIGGLLATALHGREVICSSQEVSRVDPPMNMTCGSYLGRYAEAAGGVVQNPEATSQCRYCSMKVADQYLAGRWIHYDERWRDYGIFWCYFAFNIFAAIMLYYIFRVKQWRRK